MIEKVVVANRGEIACRIIKAAKALGIRTVAIYSDIDRHAKHVKLADEAFYLGPSPVGQSYLNQNRIIDIVKTAQADAIHPGYGLLSENAEFADLCEQNNIIFVGPKSHTIEQLGDKANAKALAKQLQIPIIESIKVPDVLDEQWINHFKQQSGQWIIKACAGGGGKGMRLITADEDFVTTIELAKKEAQTYFNNAAIILERYVKPARHIEVQIVADKHGNVIHLFDRDCSMQRRYQKVIEEAPAQNISDQVRQQMYQHAINLAKAVNYENVGTVEFLLDQDQQFYFLEMNTRVQVEHCVTEEVTKQDIVKTQFHIANGLAIDADQSHYQLDGVSIEVRLCAEMPEKNFMPSVGRIYAFTCAKKDYIRIDSGYEKGHVLSPYYDSLLAKIIVWGKDRPQAIERLREALLSLYIEGIETNQQWLLSLLYHPDYVNNKIATHFLNDYKASSDQCSFDSRIALGLLGIYESLIDKHKNKWHPVKDRGAIKRFDHDNQVVSIQWHHNNDGVDLYDQQQLLANINDLRLQKGILTCCFENQEVQMYVHQTNEQDKVSIQQQSYCFNRFPAVVNKEDNVSSGDLKAPLPGSIVKIMCQPGQQVCKGGRLLVMEAMKMEHPMIAPFDGCIDHVQVDESDRVSLGDILIQMSKKDTKG